ncbi:MAG: class I SAM-dependent methyltransferase [Symploca sp. SIO2E6]|nr:class I SAM-dependent methyltransferase [Symploca sp. SIO2E6]
MKNLIQLKQEVWEDSQVTELGYWTGLVETDGEQGRCEQYLDLIQDYLGDTSDKILVDVGSGPRGILKLLKFKKGIAIDSLMEAYQEKGYSFENTDFIPIQATSEQIPLVSEYADVVFSINMLDHAQDVIKSLNEMYRILKKDGILLLICDLRESAEQTDKYHKMYFNRETIISWVEKNNLLLQIENLMDSLSMEGLKSLMMVLCK